MKHILLAVTLLIGLHSFSQKKEEKKEGEKVFYKEATVETDDYKIYIIDAVANVKQAKFKIKIFNKTNDYLLIKPTEFKYLAGDKTLLGKDKTYVVSPNEEETEVIDFRGADMLAEKYTVEFKGIYKASAGGKASTVPDFDLPASKNDFTVGNFTCDLKKADLKTDKSVVKFDCVYVGDGVGLIMPTKSTLIMPDGKENPNSKKTKPIILERGKRDDFTMIYPELPGSGDMQKQATKVKWNTTFKESKLTAIGDAKLELVKDTEKK
ncbi:MAG: hypothetical protein HY062_09910 [Bacteroidetes bacterium]|nr:hypothetical protein [Bacteroidota bacterium]